jgi:hypothetical protein
MQTRNEAHNYAHDVQRTGCDACCGFGRCCPLTGQSDHRTHARMSTHTVMCTASDGWIRRARPCIDAAVCACVWHRQAVDSFSFRSIRAPDRIRCRRSLWSIWSVQERPDLRGRPVPVGLPRRRAVRASRPPASTIAVVCARVPFGSALRSKASVV